MEKVKYKLYTPYDKASSKQMEGITSFLSRHLQSYQIQEEEIEENLSRTYQNKKGGIIIVARQHEKLVGVLVMNNNASKNKTDVYELSYLAIHPAYRRRGIGEKMVSLMQRFCPGSIHLRFHPNAYAQAFFTYIKNKGLLEKVARRSP